MIPEFMAGCLERDGDVLTPKQRASVEKIVCAEVAFDEEGDIMDMTEIYELTLQQEVLNESAWDTMAQISRARADAKLKGNDELTIIYETSSNRSLVLYPKFFRSQRPINIPSMRYAAS